LETDLAFEEALELLVEKLFGWLIYPTRTGSTETDNGTILIRYFPVG
jgi:hypothetical protein